VQTRTVSLIVQSLKTRTSKALAEQFTANSPIDARHSPANPATERQGPNYVPSIIIMLILFLVAGAAIAFAGYKYVSAASCGYKMVSARSRETERLMGYHIDALRAFILAKQRHIPNAQALVAKWKDSATRNVTLRYSGTVFRMVMKSSTTGTRS
jgi:hypothetical protein